MKKNILVSGASRNLGKFIAEQFAKDGHNVFAISRSVSRSYKNIYNIKCDLLKINQVNLSLKRIKSKFKKIDTIILCAGDSKKYYAKNEKNEDWLRSFSNNFYVCTNLIESYLKIFNYNKTKIIIFSSIAGIKVTKAPITYSVAKAALNFYAKYKAKELSNYNINLNVISPGNIIMKNNNWGKKLINNKKNVLNYIRQNVPLNTFCSPEEIFNLCKHFSTENNSAITGSNFIIDGGETL
jgi:NAD(P)-dependent dehydrogenase (short-subunit alcohol dehydrogenase family)